MIAVQTKWPTRRLADCGEWVSGGTPSKANASFWNGNIPWISSKSLKSFDLSDSEDRITQAAVENGTAFVPTGTVMFVVRGMSLANEFRVGVTTRPVAFNQDLRAIVPAKDIDGRFLTHYLKSNQRSIIGLANNASHGTKRLPTELIEAVMVPVPPLPEQRRIASILDKADAIRRKREEGIRLTEDLLRSTFLEMFGDPETNPKGWELQPLAAVVSEMEGGKSILADTEESAATRYRVLKVSAVTWADYRPHESKPVPAEYDPPPAHIVKQGDLLFSRANTTELVGATVYVFDTPPNHLLPDKLWRFVWRDDRPMDPQYVRMLFMTAAIKRELGKRATGTSGSMKNISKAKLMTIRIPVPPVDLQRAFGTFALAQHKALTARREGAEATAALFGSLVQRAFRGEL